MLWTGPETPLLQNAGRSVLAGITSLDLTFYLGLISVTDKLRPERCLHHGCSLSRVVWIASTAAWHNACSGQVRGTPAGGAVPY